MPGPAHGRRPSSRPPACPPAGPRGQCLCAVREMHACPMLPATPLLFLLCLRGRSQGGSPAPGIWPEAGAAAPARPVRVRFLAQTFQRVLYWAPGGSHSGGHLFDVQYRRYGNHSWTPVHRCTAVASHSCDLTDETREPSWRYVARVRAVAANKSSPWARTALFSPKEATIQLGNVSLSLSGNVLQVTLELGWKNATIAYGDVHPGAWGQYRVYVRRASDNFKYVLVESSLPFDLPELLWGEQYCVSVEPHLPSRPNYAKRTEEQCISTPPQDHARTTVLLSLPLLSLVALGVAGALSARAYVKRPAETPSVLKALRKHRLARLLSEPRPGEMRGLDLCMEVEPVRQLPQGLRNHSRADRVSQSSGAAWPLPEKVVCRLSKALARGPAEAPRLGRQMDSSGGSTDSGICLQEPLGSLSLLPTGLREGRRLSLGSNHGDRGLGTEGPWHHEAAPSTEMEPEALDFMEKEAGLPCAPFPRPQGQSGGPLEIMDLAKHSPSCELVAHSRALLPSGYLKQASVAAPSVPRLPAAGQEMDKAPPPSSTHCGKWHFPASMAPGSSEPVPSLPGFPKAPLASGSVGQEPVWLPPALSLLCASTPLPLSLPWGQV